LHIADIADIADISDISDNVYILDIFPYFQIPTLI